MCAEKSSRKKNSDILIIELSQDITTSYLKTLNEKTIKKIFELVLNTIHDSISSIKNRIKRIVYYLEMEETFIPNVDMVVFRFLIIGSKLGGLDYNLKEKILQILMEEIGGKLDVTHRLNQTDTDLLTELIPIRSLKTPYPPFDPTIRKFYSDDLYRTIMTPPRIFNLSKHQVP